MDFFNPPPSADTTRNGNKRPSTDAEEGAPEPKKRGRPLGAKAKVAPLAIQYWEALINLVNEKGLSLDHMIRLFQTLYKEQEIAALKRPMNNGRGWKESVERCWGVWKNEVLRMTETFVAPVVLNEFWKAQYQYVTAEIKEERQKSVAWHAECERIEQLWPSWHAECKKLEHVQITDDRQCSDVPATRVTMYSQKAEYQHLLKEMQLMKETTTEILDRLVRQEAQMNKVQDDLEQSLILQQTLRNDYYKMETVLPTKSTKKSLYKGR